MKDPRGSMTIAVLGVVLLIAVVVGLMGLGVYFYTKARPAPDEDFKPTTERLQEYDWGTIAAKVEG